ncbi:hypothetical protein AVEN_117256-1 [Araneus ventricosus]|uniref:Uncharacterized protein n=1 Tax=Araneus ventricosus TaxID=182803 RepID=A0A4Y2AY84_ARAVE|nr:hypothetical protein AVEN_117256-1 [Araneus ventricosus]
MKRFPEPNLTITKRWEIIPPEEYAAVWEELSKKRPVRTYLMHQISMEKKTECSDHETDSEIHLEDKQVHKENSNSNQDMNVYMIHPFNPLNLLYHKNKTVYS